MIRFESDYLEGALPEVMEALVRTNLEQTPGYGEDEHCARAAQLIREKCAAPEAAVHFLVGGTQANMTVIAAALRPHQAAVAAEMALGTSFTRAPKLADRLPAICRNRIMVPYVM